MTNNYINFVHAINKKEYKKMTYYINFCSYYLYKQQGNIKMTSNYISFAHAICTVLNLYHFGTGVKKIFSNR
jgi:hypothetical protein